MNNQYIRKPLTASILLSMMAFSLPVMAAEPVLEEIEPGA